MIDLAKIQLFRVTRKKFRLLCCLNTKISKTLLESLLFLRTCSVAQEAGKVNFPLLPDDSRTKHVVRKLSGRKTKKIR